MFILLQMVGVVFLQQKHGLHVMMHVSCYFYLFLVFVPGSLSIHPQHAKMTPGAIVAACGAPEGSEIEVKAHIFSSLVVN